MYNDIIIIAVCTFAIYGIYVLLREVCMLFLGERRIVAAIRVENDCYLDSERISEVKELIDSTFFLERTPILLCDRDAAHNFKNYGYDVYVKYTEDI